MVAVTLSSTVDSVKDNVLAAFVYITERLVFCNRAKVFEFYQSDKVGDGSSTLFDPAPYSLN